MVEPSDSAPQNQARDGKPRPTHRLPHIRPSVPHIRRRHHRQGRLKGHKAAACYSEDDDETDERAEVLAREPDKVHEDKDDVANDVAVVWAYFVGEYYSS